MQDYEAQNNVKNNLNDNRSEEDWFLTDSFLIQAFYNLLKNLVIFFVMFNGKAIQVVWFQTMILTQTSLLPLTVMDG